MARGRGHGRRPMSTPASARSTSTPRWAAPASPIALADELTAARAARLARVAEERRRGGTARRPSTSSAPRFRRRAARPMRSRNWRSPSPLPRERTLAVHRTAFADAGVAERIPARDRHRRPAGRRVRQRQCRDLPARAGARPERGPRTPAGAGLRGAFDRLPAGRGAGGPGRGRICHPQGRAWADLRPARGALRSRRDRRRADGAPAGGIARADHGAGDAGKPGALEIALSRHARRSSGCNAISATATASVTTGPIRGRLPRWIASSTGSAGTTFPKP